MSDTTRPLKILMLHGYRQNANSCREKSGAFRKLTKKLIDPVFISAPLAVPACPESSGEQPGGDGDQRGWWFSDVEHDSFHATTASPVCRGFEASLATLQRAAQEHGPFDGVLGFSQGATLAALLCALQQRRELDWSFSFAILVAGFRSRCEPHLKLHEETVSLPTLHVFGDADRVIPREMSEALLGGFSDAEVLTHTGGHHIPATSRQRPAYTAFLQRVRAVCDAS